MAVVHRSDAPRAPAKLSSEILDRLPPQNLEAERALIGSLLLDPQLCDEIVLKVQTDDFYSEANQRLFGHIVGMHGDGGRVDMTLLLERLRSKGDLELVGGAAYLAEVAHSVPVAAHAEYYAAIVRDKATLRELIHASTEILRSAWDPTVEPREVLNQAEETVFGVHDRRNTDQVAPIHSVLMEALAEIDSKMQHGVAGGIPTGINGLDNLTGGFHGSELIILAARPSLGKTALALNIVEYATVTARVPTLFVSLEMSRLELAHRLLCSHGRIDSEKLRKNRLSAADHRKLVETSSKISEATLYVDDTPARNVMAIAACARRLKRKQNLGMIVIDYLQLIDPDNARDQRQEQVAKVTRKLKGLARELEVPVLCLSQLNRQADSGKDGNRPRLSHLRESGAIEQDADVVMFIHREHPEDNTDQDKAESLECELIVAKQRNGPTGDVKLNWFHKYTRFEDAAPRRYAELEQFGEPGPSDDSFN